MPKKAGIITEEPTLRLALKESDFKDLMEQLETTSWDHPVFWRMRTKWSEHVRGREMNGNGKRTVKRQAS
jgi:hypothetical protein